MSGEALKYKSPVRKVIALLKKGRDNSEERSRKRNELLAATERKLRAIAEAVAREKRALRGRDKIGLRVGRELNRYKMAKHFELEIEDDSLAFTTGRRAACRPTLRRSLRTARELRRSARAG